MTLLYSEKLPPSWEAPVFNLLGVDGKQYTLDNFQDKKGLLIIFTCNHCPYAQAAWPLLGELYQQYGTQINFAAINSNDALNYPEDSYDAMKVFAQQAKIPFPYLRDESQATARAYQAQCTPDIYLFINEAGKFKLYYHGRINDNWQDKNNVTEENLAAALSRLLQDQEPPAKQPPSMGCSIKWLV